MPLRWAEAAIIASLQQQVPLQTAVHTAAQAAVQEARHQEAMLKARTRHVATEAIHRTTETAQAPQQEARQVSLQVQ